MLEAFGDKVFDTVISRTVRFPRPRWWPRTWLSCVLLGERQTTQNLTIHAVDVERGLLLIKGAVPGPRNGTVLVRTAAKGA